MHELSIALSILELVGEESRRRGGAHVAAVHLKLGPLSGVVKEALRSAFEMAREISPLADCRLVIEDVPLVVHCAACGEDRTAVSPQQICCGVCGRPTPEIVTGRELEVFAMEICPLTEGRS